MMAMKCLGALFVFMTISGVFSKTLIERIRDDSDLSQVNFKINAVLIN